MKLLNVDSVTNLHNYVLTNSQVKFDLLEFGKFVVDPTQSLH